jgi:hypothetical protein
MSSSAILTAPVRDLPRPHDVADVWLVHALEHLLDACSPIDGEHRLDASRRAVACASLAVEARINRVLREHDPEQWRVDMLLVPLEKYQLLPRLLGESDLTRHNELAELVVELFDARDGLVDAVLEPPAPTPASACGMVTAAAAVCSFLDDVSALGPEVERRASGVASRAAAATVAPPPPDAGDSFPPDLIGS